jgi:pyruvate dehydrogenase E1 component alpha subunit
LIECKTYRWRAHTERKGQPDSREKDEIEAWKGKDPIGRLERRMRDQGDLDEPGFAALDREVMGRIERAVAFAEASPFPTPEQATEDVFAA